MECEDPGDGVELSLNRRYAGISLVQTSFGGDGTYSTDMSGFDRERHTVFVMIRLIGASFRFIIGLHMIEVIDDDVLMVCRQPVML